MPGFALLHRDLRVVSAVGHYLIMIKVEIQFASPGYASSCPKAPTVCKPWCYFRLARHPTSEESIALRKPTIANNADNSLEARFAIANG